MVVGHEFSQHIGAVGNQVAGLDEFSAELLHIGLAHWICDLMGQHLEEIGRRCIESHFEGHVVHGLHPQFGRRLLAGGDVFRIGDRCKHVGVFACGRRINGALPGEDKILRGDR